MSAIFDSVTWELIESPAIGDSGLPYATHRGVLKIGAHELKVFRLNTGMSVIEADDAKKFFKEFFEVAE